MEAQVGGDPALSEAQREQMLRVLNKASQDLQEATTTEHAAASLIETAAELRALENTPASQQAEALRQAGSQLQQSLSQEPSSLLADFASELAEGKLNEAAESLHGLALDELSTKQAGALAEQLESAAEALAGSNPGLAEALSQAARALQQGDAQAAQQALEQAANQVAGLNQQAADAQAARQAAEQVAQGQQQLLQATGQGSSAGTGSQSGQGNQAGSGNQSGQGTASGAGAGESSGSEAQGSEVGNQPIQPGLPGDGGEKPYTELFAPQRLGLSEGERVALPPSEQAGGQVLGSGAISPGQPVPASVPYTSVYADYAQAYWRAYDYATVPLSLREVARKYFSSLGTANP